MVASTIRTICFCSLPSYIRDQRKRKVPFRPPVRANCGLSCFRADCGLLFPLPSRGFGELSDLEDFKLTPPLYQREVISCSPSFVKERRPFLSEKDYAAASITAIPRLHDYSRPFGLPGPCPVFHFSSLAIQRHQGRIVYCALPHLRICIN